MVVAEDIQVWTEVRPKTQATEKVSPGQVLNIDLIGKQDQLEGSNREVTCSVCISDSPALDVLCDEVLKAGIS